MDARRAAAETRAFVVFVVALARSHTRTRGLCLAARPLARPADAPPPSSFDFDLNGCARTLPAHGKCVQARHGVLLSNAGRAGHKAATRPRFIPLRTLR